MFIDEQIHLASVAQWEAPLASVVDVLFCDAALVGIGTVIGALSSDNTSGTADAQFAPPSGQSGDALWHLPKFGESGWFLHANNGRVRACNMDKVSVVGERPAPRCSKWTVD